MKLKYLYILFGVFYAAFLIAAPTKNKSQRNRQTRQTSKRRPIQRRPMQRGRNGRGPSRGGGMSTTPTPLVKPKPTMPAAPAITTSSPTSPTPTPIALQPLDISWLNGKTITLSKEEKDKAKEKRQTLEKMKSELEKAKKDLENIRAEYFPTTTDIEKKVNRALDKQRKEKKNNTNAKERQ